MAIAVGLELAPSVIRAVVLERTAGSPAGTLRDALRRVKPASVPLPSGDTPEPVTLRALHELPCETSNADALTRALTQLRTMLRVTTPVVLGIPSTAALLTTVSPLVASPQNALLGVQFELQQQLPFEIGETSWHYQWLADGDGHSGRSRVADWGSRIGGIFQVLQPASRTPRTFSAVVAAMRQSLLEERLACCRRAGLPARAVTLGALATLNAWQASVPSRAQTPGVALLRAVDEQVAEWIVWTRAGLQVVSVTSPSVDTWWQELAASYEALCAQDAASPMSIWVIAPPMWLRALEPSFGARPGLSVQAFDVTQAVRPGSMAWEHPERWVAAVGLALQGLGIARFPVNLLAAAQERARSRALHRIAAITSACCAALIVALGLTGMLQLRHRRLTILRSLERQERQYQELRPEVRALIQRQQHTEGRIVRLEQLMSDGPALTRLLAQIADGLPDEVWLTSLEGTKGETITGVLEGRAKSFQDVTRLLERLKSVPGMQTVKPLATTIIADETSGKEVIAFTVQVEQALHPEDGAKGAEP